MVKHLVMKTSSKSKLFILVTFLTMTGYKWLAQGKCDIFPALLLAYLLFIRVTFLTTTAN